MRKIKLIKTYPGSPKLGTINTYAPIFCDDYPEFWEEVIEKDYEILRIKHKENKCFYRDSIDLRNLNLYDIHSVKRLSDGKVFNIGDNATTALNNYGPITAFEIKSNVMYIRTNNSSNSTFSCDIKDLKVSKPLFTTEDGVNIFEGDSYHPVILYNLEYKGWFKAQKINKNKYTDAKSCIVFSTKKEAKQYILMNKPCLSLEDVGNIISFESYYFKEIKLLVKKKVKE
jgi:hypothetical protein